MIITIITISIGGFVIISITSGVNNLTGPAPITTRNYYTCNNMLTFLVYIYIYIYMYIYIYAHLLLLLLHYDACFILLWWFLLVAGPAPAEV